MKRVFTVVIVLALIFLFVASASSATMKKSSWFLSGASELQFSSAGGDLNKVDDKSVTRIGFDPCLGYFVMDGLGIGGQVAFAYEKLGDTKITGWEVGPKVFYYIGANSKDIVKGTAVPFLTASLLYGQAKIDVSSTTQGAAKLAAAQEVVSKVTTMHIRFGGGGIYMLSDSFGLFGEAFFELQKDKQKEPTEGDSVSGSEFGIMLGVNAFFGK